LEFGGAQRQVVVLADGLNEMGCETHIAVLSDYIPLADSFRSRGNQLHLIPKKWKYDATTIWRLMKLMRRLRPQIVHCFLLDAEIAGRIAALLTGVPVVIGSERCSVARMPWLRRTSLKLTGPCVSGIIANSQAGKSRYVRDVGAKPEKIHIVYNGVNIDRFRPCDKKSVRRGLGLPPDAKIVGMFASFKAHKNHPMYAHSARLVKNAVHDALFLAVGGDLMDGFDNSQKRYEDFIQLVKDLNLTDSFLCMGNRLDVELVYCACDVTVLTSYYEGTPNVILESMACGIPVVATAVSDNALIVKDSETGFLVPSEDVGRCADRVVRLLQEDSLRQRMGRAARADVEARFSIQALCHSTRQVYARLLNG